MAYKACFIRVDFFSALQIVKGRSCIISQIISGSPCKVAFGCSSAPVIVSEHGKPLACKVIS